MYMRSELRGHSWLSELGSRGRGNSGIGGANLEMLLLSRDNSLEVTLRLTFYSSKSNLEISQSEY